MAGLLPELPLQKIVFLRGGSADTRMTTEGLFDLWLVETPPTYSLNRFNYDDQAQLLIPRAVAYSAGLIDYFFRGRIEASGASFTDNGSTLSVSLNVKNAIDPAAILAWKDEDLFALGTNGPSTFVLTTQYQQDGNDKFVASSPVTLDPSQDTLIKPGETSKQSLTFALPAIPADATEVEFRLVFRGKLGQEEDAVAVGAFSINTGFLVAPNYLPADGISGDREIVRKGESWQLSGKQGLVAGNIDWKGAYVNGRPTKVLTWTGPSTRYFPDPFVVATENIYQSGEVYAVAPGRVLGAAITKDANGKEWLIAIVISGAGPNGVGEAVYRRPNEKSNQVDFYDPEANPNGWQMIGYFPGNPAWDPNLNVFTPWFFNGSGTKAQAMRRRVIGSSYDGLDRMLVEITDASVATFTNLGNAPGVSTTTICQATPPQDICGVSLASGGQRGSVAAGSYIIAVDYQGDTEVLAELSDTRSRVTSKEVTYSTVSSDCSRIIRTIVTAGEDSGGLVLNAGGEEIPLDVLAGKSTQTYVSSPFALDGDSMGTHDVTVLNFLDLRYKLSSGTRTMSTFQQTWATAGVVDNTYVTTTISNDQITQAVTSHLGNTTVASDNRSLSRSDTAIASGMDPGPGCNVNAAGTVTRSPNYTSVISPVPGSWVVDTAENLFISQPISMGSMAGRYFNDIAGTDPKAVIPPAPDNAHYYPVRLIE